MLGLHPLSATFVWPIKIRVHCKNYSPRMSHTREIISNTLLLCRLCSSPITWGTVIGSGDKIACSRKETFTFRYINFQISYVKM